MSSSPYRTPGPRRRRDDAGPDDHRAPGFLPLIVVVLLASVARVAVALERHERFGAEPAAAGIVVVGLTAVATRRAVARSPRHDA